MKTLHSLRVVLEGPDGTDENVVFVWSALGEVLELRQVLQRAVDECPLIAGLGLKVRVEEFSCQ